MKNKNEINMTEKTNAKEKTSAVYIPKGKGTDLFKFLLEARCKDENRPILSRVYCDKADDMGVLIATDGRRVHVLYNVWSYGFKKDTQYLASADSRGVSFVPLTNPDGQYPNWEQAMAKLGEGSEELEINTKGKSKNLLVAEISHSLGSYRAAMINGDFLVPLCKLPALKISFKKDGHFIEASGTDDESMLDYKAVIMGMRK